MEFPHNPGSNIYLIKSTPGGKKKWLRAKTGLAEKDVKSNRLPVPPSFDRFESFGHDEFTAKHCYFRCSRPPDVDRIKIFDKDDQATKHCYFIVMFSSLVIFIKILTPLTSGGLENLK